METEVEASVPESQTIDSQLEQDQINTGNIEQEAAITGSQQDDPSQAPLEEAHEETPPLPLETPQEVEELSKEEQKDFEMQNQSLDAALKLPSTKSLAAPSTIEKGLDPGKFASAKAALNDSKIYNHLSHLVLKILQLKPQNAYRDFEALSQIVKKEQAVVPQVPSDQPGPEATETAARKFADIFTATVKDTHVVTAEIPEMIDLSSVFNQAGVSISMEETYRLLQGMKRIEQQFECKSVRFFGKMFGLKDDYYIIESERVAGGDEQITVGNVPLEQGVGVNKYVYFVSINGVEGWQKLPDAQPVYIQRSRMIRKMLTGNLQREILSQPVFGGKEADYLRALIARISATTVISPNGYYKFDEDEDGVVVLNTDFEWPTPDSLCQLDNWVHHIPCILPQGRTTYVKPVNEEKPANEEENDEEEPDGEEEEDAAEVGPVLLTPISEDRPMKHDVPCWSSRQAFQHVQLKHSAVVLKSNLWPGAVTVGFNDKFANIYVGWGLKDLGEPYLPEIGGPVQQEFKAEDVQFVEQEELDAPPPEKEENQEGEENEDAEEDEEEDS